MATILMAKIPRIWVLAGCGLIAWGAAVAEPPKGGDAAAAQALRKAQGMLRQLSQEKADLEAKLVGLETQVDEQAKMLKALEAKAAQVELLQNELKQAKAGLETLQGKNATLQQQIGTQTSRLQTAAEQQRKSLGELARTQRDNLLLVNAVKERNEWIETCTTRNKSLVQANREVLEKFGNRSFWDDFKETEILTGLGSVARENAIQEFRFKLEDLQVTPWQEPQAAMPEPQAPSAAAEPSASQNDPRSGVEQSAAEAEMRQGTAEHESRRKAMEEPQQRAAAK